MLDIKPFLERYTSVPLITQNLLKPAQNLEAQIVTLVRQSEKRIADVRMAVYGDEAKGQLPTPDGRGARATANYQPIPAIAKIRAEFEAKARPMVEDLKVYAEGAQEMAKRHWTVQAMLRIAKPNGVLQAVSLRAHYAVVLAKAGMVELNGWAQTALDEMDAVLMDSVIRENDARKRDDRGFSSSELLKRFGDNWEDYRLANAILSEVVVVARRGGMAYAKFENPNGVSSVNRIALGLAVAANTEYDIDEEGGIILKPQHADHADRMAAVGAAVKAKAGK